MRIEATNREIIYIILLVVVFAWAAVAVTRSVQRGQACAKQGGAYVRTMGGYKCADTQWIEIRR